MRPSCLYLVVSFLFPLSLLAHVIENRPASRLADMPAAIQSKLTNELGRSVSKYYMRSTEGGFISEDRTRRLTFHFGAHGVKIQKGSAQWGMSLRSYGYGEHVRSLKVRTLSAKRNRVEYQYGDFTEWYANGPLGLEQGFTIKTPPQRANAGLLTLGFSLSGTFASSLDSDGRALTIFEDGKPGFRYEGLEAYDASGRQLKTWLEKHGNELLLRTDVENAKYPLMIDPIIQEAELTSSDGTTNSDFGYSVAISGDTLVVGALGETVGSNAYQGAAYVFAKPSTGWQDMTQTAELTASDGAANDWFGYAVAISGDTIVVTKCYTSTPPGADAAYVFVQPAGGWTDMHETAKLTNGSSNDYFGFSVAVDQNTIIVGDPSLEYGSPLAGATYVFVEPPQGWTSTSIPNAELTALGDSTTSYFGWSVSMSGNKVVVGANGTNFGSNQQQGAAYLFVRPLSGWSNMTETTQLLASDGQAHDQFGYSVSCDADTIAVGAAFATVGGQWAQGAVYIFALSQTEQNQTIVMESAKLTLPQPNQGELQFGYSVSLSAKAVLIGQLFYFNSQRYPGGSAFVYLKPQAGWFTTSKPSARLRASNGMSSDDFGLSVSLSGSTGVVGARNIGPTGTVYVFGKQ